MVFYSTVKNKIISIAGKWTYHNVKKLKHTDKYHILTHMYVYMHVYICIYVHIYACMWYKSKKRALCRGDKLN